MSMSGAPERRLAAILHGDVVGSSRLIAEDEDTTIRLATVYREEIELLVHQHNGRLVDFHGDEFLAEFNSAVHAVECALEIQSVLKARNLRLPAERRMQFRIGAHLGEVRSQGERLFGVGVSIAARLQSLAEPGGVCVSGKVHDELQHRLDLAYEDLGDQQVKNIPEPVRVYRVKVEPESSTETRSSPRARAFLAAGLVVLLGVLAASWWAFRSEGPARAPTFAPIRSLAVLPFENLSGDDSEQEGFADGMTDAVINHLAKIASLLVISRTSVIRYKDSDKSLPEIAEELGVEGILEGTVLRAGDRVRITAQLIDARTDTHLWSESYESEVSDVLALQSEIARGVARQLRIELSAAEGAALQVQRKVAAPAYEAFLRGVQVHFQGGALGPTSIRPQLEHFERAAELDPGFAEAFAQVAISRVVLGELSRVLEPAQRALELDDTLGLAYAAIGEVRRRVDWDFAGASAAYERALRLSPHDPSVLAFYAGYLVSIGRPEEGIALSDRAARVVPNGVTLASGRTQLLATARQYERALEQIQRVRELQPGLVSVDIAIAYWMMGRHEEARRELVAYLEQSGPSSAARGEAAQRGWDEGGWEGFWHGWLEVAEQQDGVPAATIGTVYASLGEADEAFSWLERAYRAHEPNMLLLKASPLFDPIRSDPRFDELLRRIGFPEG